METLPPGNPFVGPRALKTGEAFYGRERELRSLIALLLSERIVLFHSPSGAGKTSLIQAGLVPQLSERFRIFPLIRLNIDSPENVRGSPGLNRYIFSTLLSLEESVPEAQRLSMADLAELTLTAYLQRCTQELEDSQNMLLIFDQFEEVLFASPIDQELKNAFFEQLGEALQNRHLWVLFSIREDYIGGLAPYARHISNRLGVTYRLDLLEPEAAKQAIQKPSKVVGVEFSDAAADLLINDLRRISVQQPDGSYLTELGQYIEPVQLQVVCYKLWQSGAAEGGQINVEDLERVGSVDQALASYYANIVKSVCEKTAVDEPLVRQWFNNRLITAQRIRGQVLKGQETTEGLENEALVLFEEAHLVRGDTHGGKTWYELSHDRLVEPVLQDNADWFEDHLSVLQKQAALWAQQGREEGLLLRGKLLSQAEQDAKTLRLTLDEQDFLTASRKLQKQERRLRRFLVGLVILFAITLAALFTSFWAFGQAEARRAVALGQAFLAEGNPNLAAILAWQAWQFGEVQEAQEIIGEAVLMGVSVGKNTALLGHTEWVNSVAWSPDGQLASGSGDDTVIVWNLATGKAAQILRGNTN